MRLVSFASGSSANCTLIQSDNTNLLIDVGLSRKRVLMALNELNLTLEDIDAILVTHEHTDHIKGIDVISRNEAIDIYATKGTLEGIDKSSITNNINKELFNPIINGWKFTIGDIVVTPFDIFHDTNEPSGFTFTENDKKIGVITDTGMYDKNIIGALKGVNTLLVESNHDVNMLKEGSYPEFLKARILSGVGHMSNETCANLLLEILHDDINEILLGHLSIHNNDEVTAMKTVKSVINQKQDVDDFKITVAKRDSISKTDDF